VNQHSLRPAAIECLVLQVYSWSPASSIFAIETSPFVTSGLATLPAIEKRCKISRKQQLIYLVWSKA